MTEQEKIIQEIDSLLKDMKVEVLAEIFNLCKVYSPPISRPSLRLVD